MADKQVDPDDLAEKSFFLTLICVVLFAGAVTGYVLNGKTTTVVPETDQAILDAKNHGGEHE